MRRSSLTALALIPALAAPAAAQDAFPARLAGHAVMPAASFVEPPADAPADLASWGKFASGKRTEPIGSVMGLSGGRPTGMSTPFKGQPLQGHSGIKRMSDGSYLVLTDNGAGAKANSPDAMLYWHRYAIDFGTGAVDRKETVFLRDPDRKVPFRIANEATDTRYLTGSDFDPESIQPVGDTIWIGEEFGPYLIRADRTGKVEAVFDTLVDGKVVRSPDNPAVTTPAVPGGTVNFEIRRSKGFEGMAASPDGRFLYPLLEGPVWNADAKDWEKEGGKEYLRILEFDIQANSWTGRHWKYVLEQNGAAIGDINMIDGSTALVIERDNGEGIPERACPEGQRRTDCFHDLPKLKRVYKIEMGDGQVGKAVRKIGYVDLLRIADPDKRARKPLTDGVFAFPFFTIENVDVVDGTHIIVGNDNNLPFSSSREPNTADDNEFVLLAVPELLKAN
jgi:hypothetical protein